MSPRRLALAPLGLAACLLTGCLVGPQYQKPKIAVPSTVRGAQQPGEAERASLADLPWWDLFKDETLRALIAQAIARNTDLRIAATRVEQAREALRQAHAGFLPQAGYEVAISGGKNESLGNPIASGGRKQGTVAVAFAATWEADVWGRIRRLNELSLARYLQTEQGRRGVLLSLVSTVAQSYFELLELDLRLAIARRNVKAFQESFNLFDERLKGGKASRLETARAQGALSITAAVIPDLERRIALQENAIRLLLAAWPDPIARKATLLEQEIPPAVPPGLPSTLLERRPDILDAELSVRAANAQIGLATAAFFPRIGLTAVLGQVSSPLADAISGKSTVFGAAAAATGPLYTGGTLKSQKRQAIAQWEQTRIQYEQTVLTAFRDVSNALIEREKFEAIRTHQLDAVKAYQEAVEVALQRYNAGKSSYFEVLDAQLQLFPAENALAQTELDRRLVFVRLYQALGGGWNLTTEQWSKPGTPVPPKP